MWIASFVAGVVFALGLGIAGMTNPAKVLAFLDVAGGWDPSLLMTMLGAIAVYAPGYRLVVRRAAPVCAARFDLPVPRGADARLLGGAALFGVGWGLAGFCPGPALTVVPGGDPAVWWFVAAMAGAMVVCDRLDPRARASRDGAGPPRAMGQEG